MDTLSHCEKEAPTITDGLFTRLPRLDKMAALAGLLPQVQCFPAADLSPSHLRAQPTWSRRGVAQQVPSAGPLPSVKKQKPCPQSGSWGAI